GARQQDAGPAAGALNTGFQLGGSMGLARIGVFFFGSPGTRAQPAVTTVVPQIRAELSAAGVPAQGTTRIVERFGACLHDRLQASDPTVAPPSCRRGAVNRALPPSAARDLAAAAAPAARPAPR